MRSICEYLHGHCELLTRASGTVRATAAQAARAETHRVGGETDEGKAVGALLRDCRHARAVDGGTPRGGLDHCPEDPRVRIEGEERQLVVLGSAWQSVSFSSIRRVPHKPHHADTKMCTSCSSAACCAGIAAQQSSAGFAGYSVIGSKCWKAIRLSVCLPALPDSCTHTRAGCPLRTTVAARPVQHNGPAQFSSTTAQHISASSRAGQARHGASFCPGGYFVMATVCEPPRTYRHGVACRMSLDLMQAQRR